MGNLQKQIDAKLNALQSDVAMGWRNKKHIAKDFAKLCSKIRTHFYVPDAKQSEKTRSLIDIHDDVYLHRTAKDADMTVESESNVFEVKILIDPEKEAKKKSRIDADFDIMQKYGDKAKWAHEEVFAMLNSLYDLNPCGKTYKTIYHAFVLADQLLGEEEVDADFYLDLCKDLPQAAPLWRLYPEKFIYDQDAVRDVANQLKDGKIHTETTLSKSGKFCIGGMMGSRNSYPIAEKIDGSDDPILYHIGCFDGNKSELLQRIKAKHKENQHAQNYCKFIEEAERMLGVMPVAADKSAVRLDPAI